MKRGCESCTKCCEGYLSGEAKGKSFYPGKPCHFISIGKGCSIYTTRPNDPCAIFKCEWLINNEIPEWMKPNEINAIITTSKIKDKEIYYLNVVEAGEPLRSDVLTQLILYTLSNNLNFAWQINGGKNWIGSPEFLEAMKTNN